MNSESITIPTMIHNGHTPSINQPSWVPFSVSIQHDVIPGKKATHWQISGSNFKQLGMSINGWVPKKHWLPTEVDNADFGVHQ